MIFYTQGSEYQRELLGVGECSMILSPGKQSQGSEFLPRKSPVENFGEENVFVVCGYKESSRQTFTEGKMTYQERLLAAQDLRIQQLEHKLERVRMCERVKTELRQNARTEVAGLQKRLDAALADNQRLRSQLKTARERFDGAQARVEQLTEGDVPNLLRRVSALEVAVDELHRDRDTYRKEVELYVAALGREIIVEEEEEPEEKESEDVEATVSVISPLRQALEKLSLKERYVVVRRFGLDGGDGETLKVIGKELHLSGERIRELEAKALRKLRHTSVTKSRIHGARLFSGKPLMALA